MKNLFGVFLCLFITAGAAMAQQSNESKSQPPALQPSSKMLVKALLAADRTQNKKKTPSVEELKKTIDEEIAKSAVSSSQTPARQILNPGDKLPILTSDKLMIMVDGAIYYRFGGTIYPVPGGGASGCFDPEMEAKIQKARMKFAEQFKAEQEKAGQEKKD